MPGQVLLPSTSGLFEFQCHSTNNDRLYTMEGLITPIMCGWLGRKVIHAAAYEPSSIATEEPVARTPGGFLCA